MSGKLPGEFPRRLAMRSQDGRGPGYTAAVERSEAAFAAVRGVLGDRPRLIGNAGELAELAAALPPEISVWLDGWPRIEHGQRAGPGWVEAIGPPWQLSSSVRSPRFAIMPAESSA